MGGSRNTDTDGCAPNIQPDDIVYGTLTACHNVKVYNALINWFSFATLIDTSSLCRFVPVYVSICIFNLKRAYNNKLKYDAKSESEISHLNLDVCPMFFN